MKITLDDLLERAARGPWPEEVTTALQLAVIARALREPEAAEAWFALASLHYERWKRGHA